MDVILLEDVKGKGKKNQIIKVNNGYGNFLITNNKAVLANDNNLEILEEQIKEIEELKEIELEKAKELKTLIDSKTVKISAKAGKDGKIFGSISTKQVVDVLFNETKIKLDKKKITCSNVMNSLGTYKLDVELHKQVKAILTVQVVDLNGK